MKETVRLNGETRGKAEVIKTMRVSSRDDVLAVLTRSNQNFNRQGVRFAAEGGGIKLNGVPVDIIEYGNLAKTQQNVHLQSLPTIPETPARVTRTTNLVRGMNLRPYLGGIGFDPRILLGSLTAFAEDLQPKVIKICEKFMNGIEVDVVMALKGLLGDIKLEIIQFVIQCINTYAQEFKRTFEEQLLNENVTQVLENFGFRNVHVTINDFVAYVITSLTNDEMMDQLKKDFYSWYSSLVYEDQARTERIERRQKYTPVPKERKDCDKCGGYHYTNKQDTAGGWLPSFMSW